MRGGPVPGRAALALAALLGLLAQPGCQRQEAPPPLPAPPSNPPPALDPWSFHFVGGLVVITGEMEDSAEVTLKGTTLDEARTLPFGPIRWELLRPPPGEKADLRTRNGKLLCHFDFDAPPPAAPAPAPLPVRVASPTLPPPPSPPAKPEAAPAAPARPETAPARSARVAPLPPGRPEVSPAVPPLEGPAAPRRARILPAPPRPVPIPIPPPVPGTPPGSPSPGARGAALPPRPPAPLIAPPPLAQAPAARPTSVLPAMPPGPRPTQAAPPPVSTGPGSPHPAPAAPPAPAPALQPSPNPKVPPRAPRIQPVSALPARNALTASPALQTSSALPAVRPPAPETTARDWPGAGEGLNLLRGPKGGKRICMTFDGGSTAEVAVDVLDALKRRGIRTTIFLTGEFIRKYPDLVRRMDRDGHELGNHTFDHPHFAPSMRRDPRWTRERFQAELLDADRALIALLGRPFDTYWRAPYGEHTAEIRKWAEELGYRHVGWSEGADTLDWATIHERRLYRTGNAILDRLRARMEKQDGDGLIVLMHLGSERPSGDRPAQVLGPFLDRAIQDGWHFVTIGDYVRDLGKPRWERGRRAALLR